MSAHIKKDKYYISISCNDIYEPVSSCLEYKQVKLLYLYQETLSVLIWIKNKIIEKSCTENVAANKLQFISGSVLNSTRANSIKLPDAERINIMILQWTLYMRIKVESYPKYPIGFQTRYTNTCSVDLPWLLPIIVGVLIGRNSRARRHLINRQHNTKRRRCQYSTNILSKNTHKNKEVNKKPPPKYSPRDNCLFFSPLNSLAGLFSFQVYLTLPSAKISSSFGVEFAFIMIW